MCGAGVWPWLQVITGDECEMIQFEVQDIEDLPLDLDDIRASVLAQAPPPSRAAVSYTHLTLPTICSV
eukprot:7322345-Prymnesium_polylepis.1